MSDDPFERAIKKEEVLRRRSRPDSRRMIQMASWAYSAFMVGWTAVLFAHHKFWPEPDWLKVAHTIVFGLVVLYWLIAMVFSRVMLKRYLPDDLTDAEPPT